MTMQCAFSNRSWGIPRSGVAITSEKTVAASPNRLTGPLSAAIAVVDRARLNTIANFIFTPLLSQVIAVTTLLVHCWRHLGASAQFAGSTLQTKELSGDHHTPIGSGGCRDAPGITATCIFCSV